MSFALKRALLRDADGKQQHYHSHVDFLYRVEGTVLGDDGKVQFDPKAHRLPPRGMQFPADRAVTVLLYLGGDDDEPLEGGETAFPLAGHSPAEQARLAEAYGVALGHSPAHGSVAPADTAACEGLKVRPQKGTALIFYNLRPPLPKTNEPPSVPDISTYHQSCDVTRGTKWAANMWFYNHAP